MHIAQLLGYVIANQQQSDTWVYFHGQTEGEAEQVRAIAAYLYDTSFTAERGMDPITLMQAYTAFLLYHVMKGDIAMAEQLMRKMEAMTLGKNCQLCLDRISTAYEATAPLIPSSSCFPESVVQEERSAFSGMVFIDLEWSLVLKLPMMLDPSILDTFRRLAVSHLHIVWHICLRNLSRRPPIGRTMKSISFSQKAPSSSSTPSS